MAEHGSAASVAEPGRFAVNPVAIIGGMGPEAGVDMTARFLKACRAELGRTGTEISDQSYPPHVLIQYRVPDRTAAFRGVGDSPLPALVAALGTARAAGARLCGIACNTAHLWHAEMAALFPELTLIHIARETAAAAKQRGARTVAVLATTATHESGLYRDALASAGLRFVERPAREIEAVHDAIFRIKSGELDAATPHIEMAVAAALRDADCVVLGCTELGLVIKPDAYAGGAVIDAAQVLAARLAQQALCCQ